MPGNLGVSDVTTTSFILWWHLSTDDVGVAGYRLHYAAGMAPPPKGSAINWPPGTPQLTGKGPSQAVSGLTCGTTYLVGLQAFDAAGNVSETATVLVPTGACFDSSPPTSPSQLAQTASSETSATLSWQPSSDNIGVAGYRTYLGAVEVGQTSGTSYTFAGLGCGTNTTVAVEAYDAAGNRSSKAVYVVSTRACGDTVPPTTPGSPRTIGITETTATVAWTASTDNIGVAGYRVFVNNSEVGTTPQLSYALSALTCGTSYSVAVRAYDAAGNRSGPASTSFATSACPPPPPPPPSPGSDTQPPSRPHDLTVVAVTETSVTVTWTASTDNVGVAGYGAYRNGVLVGTTAQRSYAFTDLTCGTSATIGVDAYDAAGNRSIKTTRIVSASPCTDTTPPTPPTNLVRISHTATSLSISWVAATDNVGVVGYGVYSAGAKVGTTSATSYTVTGISCGTNYTIGVDAYDASGNRSTQTSILTSTSTCGDVDPPPPPTALATSSITQTSIKLSWTAPTPAAGIAGYDVYADATKAGTTTSTSYTLNGLACGKAYVLGVESFDAAGNRSTRAKTNASTAGCSAQSGGTLFVAPNGNDAGSCTQQGPCASFNRAYQLAQPGSMVEVEGGTYSGQTIKGRQEMRYLSPGCTPETTANCVIFRPASGKNVVIDGELSVHGSSVYVDGSPSASFNGAPGRGRSYNWRVDGYVATEADSASVYPDHVVIAGIDSANFGVFNVDTVTFKNLDVGPATVSNGCAIKEGPGFQNKIGFGSGITYVPRNVTLDGLIIHNQNGDIGRLANNCHFGGLFLVTVDGLTIRNSVFSQNVVYNIQVQNFSGPPATNVTLENNWFGCSVDWLYVSDTKCANQADVQFNAASGFSNWVFRNNSFVGGIGQYVPGASYTNVTVVGNTGGSPSMCYWGMTFRYNAWEDAKCSSTDKSLSSLPFVNPYPGSEDLHLVPGSPAIDAGDPSDSPSSDIDGQSRPSGGAPDAGSDEAG